MRQNAYAADVQVHGRTDFGRAHDYAARMPEHDELAALRSSEVTYEWAKLLLARAHFNGSRQALDAAWQRVRSYGRNDISCQLPVELAVACGGRARCLCLHRRFDRHGQKIFIVADEGRERSMCASRPTAAGCAPTITPTVARECATKE